MAADLPVHGVRLSLWRSVTAFRVVTLFIDLALIGRWYDLYERPRLALLAGAGMVVVTATISVLALRGRAHRLVVVAGDVLVTIALTLLSAPVQTGPQQHGGMVTLTTIWAAAPTLEAAFLAGPVGGLVAAVLQYLSAALVAGTLSGRTLYSGVLLAVAGGAVGLVVNLAVRAERDLQVAVAARAELAERQRITRSIHDGVLQVLGLVHRTGADAPGPWPAIAAAAAEQEAALRALITSAPDPARLGRSPGHEDVAGVDLGAALRGLRSARVTVATPADPVELPQPAATELLAAVRAALHNVEQHAGPDAQAWVLLEDTGDEVSVTVRDDGVGFPAGRLDRAADDGRLGVARSILGRVSDLGGRGRVSSAPGEGVEVELHVPHAARRPVSGPR